MGYRPRGRRKGFQGQKGGGFVDASEAHMAWFYDQDHKIFRWALRKAGLREGTSYHLGPFWLLCHKRWPRYDPLRGPISNWIIRQARDYLAQMYRARGEASFYGLPELEDPEGVLARSSDPPFWGRMRRMLSPAEAEVVEAVVFGGESPQDYNRRKGLSHNAAHTTLKSAMTKLRRKVQVEDRRIEE